MTGPVAHDGGSRHLVHAVSAGSGHTCAVLNGTVYSCGWGSRGQLGHGTDENVTSFLKISALSDNSVAGVACGAEHTMVLTSAGQLYAFGCGQYGQLGLGDHTDVMKPTLVNALSKFTIISVSCGQHHTLAVGSSGGVLSCQGLTSAMKVTSSGDVFAWGWNKYGQLGLGDSQNRFNPSPVRSLPPRGQNTVTAVACGAQHSACVTADGRVYTWGWGGNGRLGHGNSSHQAWPRRVNALRLIEVINVACGETHTAVVTSQGDVYAWGGNRKGQTALENADAIAQPRLVSSLRGKQAVQVSCGNSHTAVRMATGDLYMFGSGKHGQLGTGEDGEDVTKSNPTLVEGCSAVAIACGGWHSAALMMMSAPMIATCGWGQHGQLGNDDCDNKNRFGVVLKAPLGSLSTSPLVPLKTNFENAEKDAVQSPSGVRMSLSSDDDGSEGSGAVLPSPTSLAGDNADAPTTPQSPLHLSPAKSDLPYALTPEPNDIFNASMSSIDMTPATRADRASATSHAADDGHLSDVDEGTTEQPPTAGHRGFEDLVIENKDLAAQVRSEQRRCARLQRENERLQIMTSKLEGDLKESREVIRSSDAVVQRKVEDLTKRLSSLSKEKERYTTELERVQHERDSLASQVKSLQSQLAELEQTIADLESARQVAHASTMDNPATTPGGMGRGLGQRSPSLVGSLSRWNAMSSPEAGEDGRKALTQELRKISALQVATQAQLHEREDEIGRLNEELKRMQQGESTIESDAIRALESKLEVVESEKNTQIHACRQLLRDARTTAAEMKSLHERYERLRQQSAEEVGREMEKATAANRRVGELESQLVSMSRAVEEAEARSRALEEESRRAPVQAPGISADLRGQLAEKSKELSMIHDRLNEQRAETHRKEKEILRLNEHVQTLEDNQKLMSLRYQGPTDDEDDRGESTGQLMEQLRRAEDQVTVLKASLDSSKKAATAAEQELQSALDSHRAQRSGLEQACAEAAAAKERAAAQLEERDAEVMQLRVELDEVQTTLARVSSEAQELLALRASLRESDAELSQGREALESALGAQRLHEEEIAALGAELATTREQYDREREAYSIERVNLLYECESLKREIIRIPYVCDSLKLLLPQIAPDADITVGSVNELEAALFTRADAQDGADRADESILLAQGLEGSVNWIDVLKGARKHMQDESAAKERLEKQLQEMGALVEGQDVDSRVKTMTESVADLMMQAASVREENDILTSTHRRLLEEIDSLREMLKNEEETKAKHLRDIESLHAKIREAETRTVEQMAESSHAHRNEVLALTERLSEKDKIISEKDALTHEMRVRERENDAQVKLLASRIEEMEIEIVRSESKLAEAFEANQAELKDETSAHLLSCQKIESLECDLAALAVQRDALQEERSGLLVKVQSLEGSIAELKDHHNDLKEVVRVKTQLADDAVTERERANHDRNLAVAAADKHKKAAQESADMMENAVAEKDSLVKSVQHWQGEFERISALLSDTAGGLSKGLEAEVLARLEAEHEASLDHASDCASRVAGWLRDRASSVQAVSIWKHWALIERAQKDRAEALLKLGEVESDQEFTTRQLQFLNKVQDNLTEARKDADSAVQAKMEMEQDLLAAQQQLEETKKKYGKAKRVIETLTRERDELLSVNNQVTRDAEEIRSQMSKANDEVQDTQHIYRAEMELSQKTVARMRDRVLMQAGLGTWHRGIALGRLKQANAWRSEAQSWKATADSVEEESHRTIERYKALVSKLQSQK